MNGKPTRRPASGGGTTALLVPTLLFYLLTLVLPLVLLAVRSLTAGADGAWSLANYAAFFSDPFYLRVLAGTFRQAVIVTAICILIGWPMAAFLSQMGRRWRLAMTLIIVAPLLISVVVRTFGWVVLLGPFGLVDQMLDLIGLGGGRPGLLFTEAAVTIGMVHVLLPMMIVAISSAMGSIEPSLLRAAVNLGSSPLGAVWRVMVPLSMPGVVAGATIVFSLTMTAFVTPNILGGATKHYMSSLIYQNTMVTLNLPLGGALSVILLLFIITVVAIIAFATEKLLFPGVFHGSSSGSTT
jgi:putative spermidine/putrescine transport system permease protein